MAYTKHHSFILAKRDLQLLNLAAQGMTATEIGKVMQLSGRTINNVMLELQKHFQARNITHLIAICYQQGIIKTNNEKWKEGFYEYGRGLGIRINDLQRLRTWLKENL